MRFFGIAFFFIPFLSFGMTLEEIPSAIREKNKEVQEAKKDAEAVATEVGVARARYFPSLELKNTYFHLGENLTLKIPQQTFQTSLTGVSVAVNLPPITLQGQDFFGSRLVLTQPLYAGGRISAAMDAAVAQREEGEVNHSKVIEEQTREAFIRYFSVQLARKISQTLHQMKVNLDRIQAISEALIKTGLGTKFSNLQVQVAQADLAARITEAEGKAELADLAFKVTVGREPLDKVEYLSPLKRLSLEAKAEAFKMSALEKRKEFAILDLKETQVDALKAVHTGEMLPKFYGFAWKQLLTANLPVIQPEWVVGLGLDIPLTSWIGSLPARQKAALLQEKVEILRGRAREEIPLQIEKIFLEAKIAESSLAAIEQGVTAAQEALRLAEIRFKSGDSSGVEVLQSTTDLEKMEIRKLQLTEELNRKLIDLYHASGEISRYVEVYSKTVGLTPGNTDEKKNGV